MTMKWLIRVALFSMLLALALPPTAAAQSAADLYKSKCAACHATDGSGKQTMGTKDLGGAEVKAMSDVDMIAIVENGKGKMPAYKGKLTDAQIKDLVAYMRSLKK